MPRRDRMGRGARMEKAFEMFSKGYSHREVATEIGVHTDTVTRYKRAYEESIQQQASANPHLLRDVLGNTLRTLEELDRVRAQAWELHENTESPSLKNQALNTVLKAQSERAKLFGLMGVKQDTLVYINGVKDVQNKLMDFMQKELCSDDRAKLERYLQDTFREELAQASTPADLMDGD